MHTLIEADTTTGEVVRVLGEWATFADAYAFVTTGLGLEELDLSNKGFWRLDGDRAVIICTPFHPEMN